MLVNSKNARDDAPSDMGSMSDPSGIVSGGGSASGGSPDTTMRAAGLASFSGLAGPTNSSMSSAPDISGGDDEGALTDSAAIELVFPLGVGAASEYLIAEVDGTVGVYRRRASTAARDRAATQDSIGRLRDQARKLWVRE